MIGGPKVDISDLYNLTNLAGLASAAKPPSQAPIQASTPVTTWEQA